MKSVVSFLVCLAIFLFWYFAIGEELDDIIIRKFNKHGWKRGFWCGLVQFATWYFGLLITTCATYRLVSGWIPYLLGLEEKL